jgi:AcrR family transcriptional regulator
MTTTTTGPGRPPDPGLVERVHKAACRVYGQHGWRGFTIEAVAKDAAVGKASIYARWNSKAELLADSLAAQIAFRSDVDTGDVRADLTILARSVCTFYNGEFGDAALRLLAESRLNPDLGARFEEFRDDAIRAARKVVKRAITRGDLPARTPVNTMLEALFGGVLMLVVTTPSSPARRQALPDREVGKLVDLVLQGVRP